MPDPIEYNAEVADIVYRYLSDEPISDEERSLMERWLRSSNHNQQVFDEISDPQQLKRAIEETSAFDKEKLWNKVMEHRRANEPTIHRVRPLKTTWFKYAAAILLIVTGASVYYIFSHTSDSETKVVQNVPPSVSDILPGSDRAILTLSNGQQVVLNDAASETIKDGTLSIKNRNGELIYSGRPPIPSNGGVAPAAESPHGKSLNAGAGVGLNTMSTPRGGQYQLTLSDGSKVWLNAASSITYPISFNGKTREVSITGEAYFEVKANKEKPFIVKTGSDRITVLGTSFNVNAYEDEGAVKTSLVDGVVKVGDTFIKPGHAYRDGKISKTDVQQDVAWKNGVFNFENTNITEAMRQLARWYDLQIVYEGGKIPDIAFGGKMGMDLKLSQVLKGLQASGLKFRIETGNKLIITQ